MTERTGVSVVVPVFRSGPSLGSLVERIGVVLAGVPHEVVLVDDGSDDGTWAAVTALAAGGSVVGVRLGRNAGQHNATLAGVRRARFPITVTLDDDLQQPPEEIPRLLARLAVGDCDVVNGVPPEAAHRGWRRLSSRIARWVLGGAMGREAARGITSFRAFRTALRAGFAADIGPSVTMEALLSWSTARFVDVEVAHHPRREGTSGYTVRSLVRFAVDTLTAYSTLPLRVATVLGLGTALAGVALLVFVVGRYVIDGTPVVGFPFLASTIALFSGVQLLTLGVIGEYLARMHFRLMRKPTYVVAEVVGTSDTDS
jgi:glycosyltransferase involved in cell wall biosynthesis